MFVDRGRPMRTLIVSDLHMGAADGADLLRRPDVRAVLLERLADADRLVLLGDVLELRHGPAGEAVLAARDLFEDLGRAMAGREIVIVAGNHDQALVGSWLARRAEERPRTPLASEQRFAPDQGSAALARLAGWAGSARVSVAHPGLWLRPDVYATHGHYLDCHLTVPTLERLGLGLMSRVLQRPARDFAGADDYEAASAPLYAWIDAVARQAETGSAVNGQLTVRAWEALRPTGRSRLRPRLLAAAFPLGVAALNRAGLGPLRADLSGPALRRAGVQAMGEVAEHLDLGAAHVVFGHTHRAGPLPGEAWQEWGAPSGARLVNSGCWTYDSYFVRRLGSDSPYWPGGMVLVEEHGAPRLVRLLSDYSVAQLAPGTAASGATPGMKQVA